MGSPGDEIVERMSDSDLCDGGVLGSTADGFVIYDFDFDFRDLESFDLLSNLLISRFFE